jgi:hypothetical protein
MVLFSWGFDFSDARLVFNVLKLIFGFLVRLR